MRTETKAPPAPAVSKELLQYRPDVSFSFILSHYLENTCMSLRTYLADLEKRPHWQATMEDKHGPLAVMSGYPGHFEGHYYLYNGKNHDGLRPYRAKWVQDRIAFRRTPIAQGHLAGASERGVAIPGSFTATLDC